MPATRVISGVQLLQLSGCLALAGCTSTRGLPVKSDSAGGNAITQTALPASNPGTLGQGDVFDEPCAARLALDPPAYDSKGWTKWPLCLVGGIGYAHADDPRGDDSNYSVERWDDSFQAGAGYRVHRFVSVEAGYVNFGERSYDLTGGMDDGHVKTSGVQISVVGQYPIWSISDTDVFQALARIGAFNWHETDRSDSGAGRWTSRDSDTDLYYGLGLQLYLTGPFCVRFEWTRLDRSGHGTDLDAMMLSVVWLF